MSGITAENLFFPSVANLDVASVCYMAGKVDIILASMETGASWRLHFPLAAGVRVLDEGDLLEFWPECSSSNSQLFRICSGGWLEQEKGRAGFILGVTQPDIHEYFVTGENACVGVLAFGEPEIIELRLQDAQES